MRRGNAGPVAAALILALCGCSGTPNAPSNKALVALTTDAPAAATVATAASPDTHHSHPATITDDGMIVGVALSGGGTRAAAFGFGVLKEFAATEVHLPNHEAGTLFDHIDFVSGVSGGSVLAAYVGLRNNAALADFRERFLLRDAEENLSTSVSVTNLGRALGGGINGADRITSWLDANLYEGATLGDLEKRAHPHVYIYASDIYNADPFVFSRSTFATLCSDFDSFPLSQAVAASAAVPFVFSPIVVQNHSGQCNNPLPKWVERGDKREDSAILKAVAQGLRRYREPNRINYVKLVDGGVTDNFGVSGFVVDHESGETAYAPLSEHQAVMLRRALVLVVNAGQAPTGDWIRTPDGPTGIDLVNAVTNTMVASSSRNAFDAFRQTFFRWRDEVVRWRCRLPAARVKELRGTLSGWNCRDVEFQVGEISFDQLPPDRAKMLGAVATRFKLPENEVDALIAGGRDALRASSAFQEFLRGVPGTRVRPQS